MESPEQPMSSVRDGRERFFPEVPLADWNDWRWQYGHRISDMDTVARLLPMSADELEARRRIVRTFRMGVTPYYFSLIDPDDPRDPILRQAIPAREEFLFRASGMEDPLAEESNSPVPGLTHRYPDRCLMVVSNLCATYCRHCTRKRIMAMGMTPRIDLARMLDYIRRTPQIRDVIVTGGDPLCFPTEHVEGILAALRAIPHVEIIRIGSRVPVTMPQRITPELCEMLERYHPIWLNTHFNHARECTPEAARAADRLLRAGIPVNNQTVLLKGVNDDVRTMRDLMHALLRLRVRPYYIFQCDPVRGTEHLRTPISKGIEIMEGLRGHTSGLAVPYYVIDAPGGGGKIPILPEYLLSYDRQAGRMTFRNYAGKVFEYLEPAPPVADAAERDSEPDAPERTASGWVCADPCAEAHP